MNDKFWADTSKILEFILEGFLYFYTWRGCKKCPEMRTNTFNNMQPYELQNAVKGVQTYSPQDKLMLQ